MVKTNAPSEFQIAGLTIKTNALPDPFDEMDLIYRPRLQPLPHAVDTRAGVPVLDQTGESCTGHAVGSLIDTVLSEADSRSKAKGHGEFDDDPDTMTSVILRIKGSKDLGSVTPYPRGGMPTSKS